jgi:hypothetical protein
VAQKRGNQSYTNLVKRLYKLCAIAQRKKHFSIATFCQDEEKFARLLQDLREEIEKVRLLGGTTERDREILLDFVNSSPDPL